MVCMQVKIYIGYYIIQTILGIIIMGYKTTNIFSGLIGVGVIYMLCEWNYKMIANVLLTLSIMLGAYVDIYGIYNPKYVQHLLHVQPVRK